MCETKGVAGGRTSEDGGFAAAEAEEVEREDGLAFGLDGVVEALEVEAVRASYLLEEEDSDVIAVVGSGEASCNVEPVVTGESSEGGAIVRLEEAVDVHHVLAALFTSIDDAKIAEREIEVDEARVLRHGGRGECHRLGRVEEPEFSAPVEKYVARVVLRGR